MIVLRVNQKNNKKNLGFGPNKNKKTIEKGSGFWGFIFWGEKRASSLECRWLHDVSRRRRGSLFVEDGVSKLAIATFPVVGRRR
ncbi:hypothetical protein Lalb_Chr23g0273941 [Lupinus albus]|uniref:Uncharacterized protein n=1 Tax=Lupinus albus TaxID=3870 RepID=A0A6A4NLP6_LUPAL|nr:hypothetical protein Lalb_Chr23g0273941 [Lupinus albus]